MDKLSAQAPAFFRAPGDGPTLNVLGVTHIYKAQARETGGRFSLWEAVIPPGAGAPPHTHSREDEAIYVLSGELVIEREGEAAPLRLGPGAFFFGARERQHSFRNESGETVRALILCTPGAGLDHMFGAVDALMADPLGPPPVSRIAAIAAEHGVTIAAPA